MGIERGQRGAVAGFHGYFCQILKAVKDVHGLNRTEKGNPASDMASSFESDSTVVPSNYLSILVFVDS